MRKFIIRIGYIPFTIKISLYNGDNLMGENTLVYDSTFQRCDIVIEQDQFNNNIARVTVNGNSYDYTSTPFDTNKPSPVIIINQELVPVSLRIINNNSTSKKLIHLEYTDVKIICNAIVF